MGVALGPAEPVLSVSLCTDLGQIDLHSPRHSRALCEENDGVAPSRQVSLLPVDTNEHSCSYHVEGRR